MLRRQYSAPERITMFGCAVALVAPWYQDVSAYTGFSLACPLRSLTGIPCPACGLTTAATGLATGDLGAAWSANPAIYGLAILVVVMTPVLAARMLGWLPPPQDATPETRRKLNWATAGAALLSWLFQLHRGGLI